MVDRRKAFSLISSQDHCQRPSPPRISGTLKAWFEHAQSLSSGWVEWSCAVMITTKPWGHITTTPLDLDELLELIVEQSNLYTHHNGRNFTVTKEELKAFLNINFVMAINMLLTIAEYWRADNLIGNDGVQNTMTQNLHFADNRKDDKTDKAFKMKPVIEHLNSKFSEVLLNDSEQNID